MEGTMEDIIYKVANIFYEGIANQPLESIPDKAQVEWRDMAIEAIALVRGHVLKELTR
jgi:hypothetical protein